MSGGIDAARQADAYREGYSEGLTVGQELGKKLGAAEAAAAIVAWLNRLELVSKPMLHQSREIPMEIAEMIVRGDWKKP